MKEDNNNMPNNKNNILNPNFVTGLTDAEGCFLILSPKNNKTNSKVYFSLKYKISMLNNEVELLKMVKSFFDCGVLRQNKNGTTDFEINDFSSLKIVLIPHFLKYPLRGTKYLDFLSFKEASLIFDKGEHLKEEGINKLCLLKKNMNIQRDFSQFNSYSPNHTKENNINYIPINGHYVNGFIAGDGCLTLDMGKHFGYMHLSISQHKNNRLLMESIANYFKSPLKVYPGRSEDLQIHLRGVSLWENIIFKHFELYPLYGCKKLRLNKLLLIRELKKDNKHLMQVGRYKEWRPEYKLRIIEIWNN